MEKSVKGVERDPLKSFFKHKIALMSFRLCHNLNARRHAVSTNQSQEKKIPVFIYLDSQTITQTITHLEVLEKGEG